MSVFDETEYDSVEDTLQSVEENSGQVVNGDETLDEAVARIEEANLWKTLYSTEVFPQGSARDSIRSRLNEKLKSIALEEIQVLLGMRQVTRASLLESVGDESQKSALLALANLDQEQISALVKLANKVLQRNPAEAQIAQVATYSPKVATIQASPATSTAKVNSMMGQSQQAQQQAKHAQPRKQRAKKGQTAPQGIKPIPPAPADVLLAQGAIKATAPAIAGDIGKAMGNLIQSMTQGNILHVDNNTSNEGDDVNERF